MLQVQLLGLVRDPPYQEPVSQVAAARVERDTRHTQRRRTHTRTYVHEDGLKGSTMAPRSWHQAVPDRRDALDDAPLCSPIDRRTLRAGHRERTVGRLTPVDIASSLLRILVAITLPLQRRRRPRSPNWIMDHDPFVAICPGRPKWA